ncbi:hypothetical protein PJI17_31020, partial [Mycobacterium kansasii]
MEHIPKSSTTSKLTQSKERGEVYLLKEDDDINVKVANLTRKLEAIELKKDKVNETVCGICDGNIHTTENCPTINEESNAVNNYQRPFNGPTSNTYNRSW